MLRARRVLRSSSRPPRPVLSMNSTPLRSSRRRSQSSAAAVTAVRSSPTFDRSISPLAATMAVEPSREAWRVRSSSMSDGRSTRAGPSPNVRRIVRFAVGPDHDHLSATQLRVRALESVLTAKGYVDPAALDALIETYETRVGPHNGARVVARAWVDAAYRARLFGAAAARVAELDIRGRRGGPGDPLEHAPGPTNRGLPTLPPCAPGALVGPPPVWYKSAPYRSRA